MAMFGKNGISTTVAYEEDKKKPDKKKGLLNMPISTNIQYSKNGAPDGNMPARFDSFDPFDDFKVGERVEMTADGKLVAVHEEEVKATEQVAETVQETVTVAKEELKATADSFSFEPDFGAPFGAEQDAVPVPVAPVAPAPAPVASAPAPVAPVASAPAPVQVVSSEMSPEAMKKVSDAVAEEVSRTVTAQISKELSSKLASQVASEVTKSMPTPTGDGEVKVLTPQVSKDVLDAVVKEVTESVTKSVKEEIAKSVVAQLTGIAPAVSANVTDQMGAVSEKVSASVTGQINAANDNLAKTIGGQISDATNHIERRMVENLAEVKTEIPSSLTKGVDDIYSNLLEIKKLLEKPADEMPASELDTRVEAEMEKHKSGYIKNTIVPLLLTIIEAKENITRMTKSYKEKGTDVPVGIFNGYALDFRDLLEKHKVEIYQSAKGDEYNPAIHKLLSKVSANKEEQHNTVASSQCHGYKYNGEVIYPEKVEVYSYSK